MPDVYSLVLKFQQRCRLVWVGLFCLLLLVSSGCRNTPKQSRPAKSSLITLATWGNHAEIAQLKAQLTLFHAQHPNIQVQLRHIPENYLQKLHILAAARLLPDVFLINSWHLPMFAHHQLVADLSQHVPKAKLEQTFYPVALKALSYGDTIIGALPRDISNVVMYVNTDLLKQYGLPQPRPHWTMAEFMALASAVCEKNKALPEQTRAYATSFYRQPALFWLPWLWSNGGDILTGDNQWAIQHPQSRKALQQYLNFHTGSCPIAPNKIQMGQANPTQWFLQQRLAFLVSGRWVTPLFREQATFHWDVWPIPEGSNGSVTGVDATGYAMAAHTLNPNAALELITFLTRQEAVAQVSKSGLVVPARPDVANSDAFLSPHQPPAHGHVFLQTLRNGHPTPNHPKWGAMEEQLVQTLGPYWDARTPVTARELEQALNSLTPTISP